MTDHQTDEIPTAMNKKPNHKRHRIILKDYTYITNQIAEYYNGDETE